MSDGGGEAPDRRTGDRDPDRDRSERRATRTPGPTREGDSLADVVEMLLDKGVVINADIAVSVGETELLGVHIRAALASFETAAEYGLQFPDGTDMRRVEAASGRTEMHSEGGTPLAVGSPGTPTGGPSPKNPVEDDGSDESDDGSDESDDGDEADDEAGGTDEEEDDVSTDSDADGSGSTGDAGSEANGEGGSSTDTDGDGAEAETEDREGEAARDAPSSEVTDDAS